MQLSYVLVLVSASLLVSLDPACGAAFSENEVEAPSLRERRDIVALVKDDIAAEFRGVIEHLRAGKSLTELSRNRRDVAASDLDIPQLVTDLVNTIIQAVTDVLMKPIKNMVNATFDTIVNTLMQFYTAVPPQNGLDGLLSGVTNTAIRAVVEILELTRTFVNSVLDAVTLPLL